MRPTVHEREVIHIFYDGSCGLCHAFVRFVLFRMKKEEFLFSPLGGSFFSKWVATKRIVIPKNSVVVYDPQNQKTYFKGKAVIYILLRLGVFWKCIAFLLRCFPSMIVDFGYDMVAKIRSKIFKKPEIFCPVTSDKYRKFFKE